jgi:hypothetical protein
LYKKETLIALEQTADRYDHQRKRTNLRHNKMGPKDSSKRPGRRGEDALEPMYDFMEEPSGNPLVGLGHHPC